MAELKLYRYLVTYETKTAGFVISHKMEVLAANAKDAVRTVQFRVRQSTGKWSAYHCVAKRVKEQTNESNRTD